MCGIVGYIGNREAAPILLEGLHRLEYRGYDSAGMATIQSGALEVHRCVGRVAQLESTLPEDLIGTIGIAHTRWATHGGVTVENAHPHVDASGRIAVVHNGIIENAALLRARLKAEGVSFRSDTDTEVLAHLIGRFYGGNSLDGVEGTDDPVEAVRRALLLLRGTWGIAVTFADQPDCLVTARNGSPLVIGLGQGEVFLASDPHALVRYTRRVIYLEDREIALLDANGVETSRLGDDTPRTPFVHTLEDDWIEAELEGFPHYMLKEIHEQQDAMQRALSGRVVPDEGTAKLGGLDMNPRDLVSVPRVGLLGCGTSFHAC
ncbi:MAG: glutamine--fructose-6-phosphate aminotransferase, partial [Myxococcota bacterium]|nr:glutamine--fructose-6-phosphate aminotransferase [Myxococcota bacterium]